MFKNQKEQSYMFTTSESYPSMLSGDFVFDEFENFKTLGKLEGIKCENAFEKHIYPFGDWRDMCDINSKDCNFDQIFILTRQSDLKSIELEKDHSPLAYKIFKIEKIKKCHNPQLDMSNSFNNEEIKESILCSNILDNKISKSSKSCRRDVINKSILRYFNKFMKNMFIKQLKDLPWLKKKDEYSLDDDTFSSIVSILIKLKLLKSCEKQNDIILSISLVEYVNWLIFGSKISDTHSLSNLSSTAKSAFSLNKHLSSVELLNEFDSPAKIMNELLLRYNHCKLQKFFENKALRILFSYFIKVEKDNFMNKLDDSKKSKFIEAIDDFERNILSYQ